MRHAKGCDPKTHCQGCVRAGEDGAPASPSEVVAAQALDQQWVENLVRRNQELEKENEQLRERLRT
jgi:hypothetical protein